MIKIYPPFYPIISERIPIFTQIYTAYSLPMTLMMGSGEMTSLQRGLADTTASCSTVRRHRRFRINKGGVLRACWFPFRRSPQEFPPDQRPATNKNKFYISTLQNQYKRPIEKIINYNTNIKAKYLTEIILHYIINTNQNAL